MNTVGHRVDRKRAKALRKIVQFIEKMNRQHGRTTGDAKINVHFISDDVRHVYRIAKDALE